METGTLNHDGNGDPFVDELFDAIDFEREFGAFDVASLFPPFSFVHDHFIGFYNILTNGYIGSPPITTAYVPAEAQQRIIQSTRKHCRKNCVTSFYYLTMSGFMMVCQVVYQLSYAIVYNDLALLAVFQHQLPFVFILYCVYYGVEHYMLSTPKDVSEVPARALRLCFTKALNKLGQKLAMDPLNMIPFKQQHFTMPSGGNVLEVKYYSEQEVDKHQGMPYDPKKSYTMNIEVTVHTFEMLPCVKKEQSASYINHRYGKNVYAERLNFPGREENSSQFISGLKL